MIVSKGIHIGRLLRYNARTLGILIAYDVAITTAYLKAGAAFVGMGGKLVDESLVAAGDQAAVTAVARQILGTA